MSIKGDPIEYCKILTSNTKVSYEAIGNVYCPILKETVIFNANGFHHLLYEAGGTPRDVSERIYKLVLFPLVIPVIKNALSVAEERDIEVKASRKKNAPKKKGKHYALVAIVGKKKPVAVRVVLQKIGTGNLTFLSVMKNPKPKNTP